MDYKYLGLYIDNTELVEAMLFAIDRINNDMSLLPNLTIGFDVRDSHNDQINSLAEAIDFELTYDKPNNKYTPVLLGSAYPAVTHQIATLLSTDVVEIPLISYASSDAALSNKDLYGYLLRTIPSDNLQTEAMVDLVSYFGWEYVSVIFNDNDYGISASNAFANSAMKRDICIDKKIGISSSEINKRIGEAAQSLLESRATVVVLFIDNDTAISALFEELIKSTNNTNGSHKFVWIFSNEWKRSQIVHTEFLSITIGIYIFQPQIDYVEEFDDYFSQLTPFTNYRNPYFNEYWRYAIEYEESGSGCTLKSGYYCPKDKLGYRYSQGETVPFVIDAVYAYAHALQNFLDNNCNEPLRWDYDTRQCDGMKYNLSGENFLGYLHNVIFNGIRNHTVSFDKNGDPAGAFEISSLQTNESAGEYNYISVGFWNSAYKKNALVMNNTNEIEKVISRCSEPCSEGMIRSITNQNCPSCFKCIPCVGSTYSMNSNGINCSLCDDNHWGNDPLSGSTHCVPVKVQHLDYSNGWSIISMCFASIALIN